MFKIFENPIRIMLFYLKSVNVKQPYFWFVLGWEACRIFAVIQKMHSYLDISRAIKFKRDTFNL